MSERTDERQPYGRPPEPERPAERAGWVTGTVVFAGVMMVLVGVFQFLNGMAAVINHELFVATPDHLYELDVRWWGWAHVVAGVVIALAGVAVFTGRLWARVVGIVLASLSLIANFVFIPYSPVWSLLIIAIDVVVIYALAVTGRRPVF
jgi:hypothetical protein